MIKKYYELTKPGIVYGNGITAIAGFFLASKGNFQFLLFAATLFGLSCIIAAGCVLNNYFDRMADQQMARTKMRALAVGTILPRNAIFFALTLLFLGVSTLTLFTTFLATFAAVLGFIIYVGFYTFWKYKTVYGTEIGSLAGAVPAVVGYSAVTGQFDLAAALFFSIMVLWQMPHFFAIAIYRMEEYASASIPVLPIKRGVGVTKLQMLIYICAFLLAALSLTIFGCAGYVYFTSALALGLYWLWGALQGFNTEDDNLWAKKVFLSSLIVIMGLCTAIALDSYL